MINQLLQPLFPLLLSFAKKPASSLPDESSILMSLFIGVSRPNIYLFLTFILASSLSMRFLFSFDPWLTSSPYGIWVSITFCLFSFSMLLLLLLISNWTVG